MLKKLLEGVGGGEGAGDRGGPYPEHEVELRIP